jgi:hypothetical protein
MLTRQTNGKLLLGDDEKLRENWDRIEWGKKRKKKGVHNSTKKDLTGSLDCAKMIIER